MLYDRSCLEHVVLLFCMSPIVGPDSVWGDLVILGFPVDQFQETHASKLADTMYHHMYDQEEILATSDVGQTGFPSPMLDSCSSCAASSD
eukprot:2062499-Amphidinium_carterae.6